MRTHTHLAAALLIAGLPALAMADDLIQQKVNAQGPQAEPATIYLGTVAVGGKQEVFEALQDIKVALDQPFSTDPKLADVVVCRITDDIGSHTKQLLVCATNRELVKNKEILQTAMDTAISTDPPKGGDNHGGSPTTCSGSCFQTTVNILNMSLNNQRRHYIKQQVNGAALRALLAKLPGPQQTAVPAAATVPAPAAVTAHL